MNNIIKGWGRKVPLLPSLYYYLWQLPGLVVTKGLLLGRERLTGEEKGLIAKNRRQWRKLEVSAVKNEGFVLVDALVNGLPGFYYSGAVAGKYLSHLKNSETLFLIEKFYVSRIKRIISSYGADGFISLDRRAMVRAGADAAKIFRSLSGPDDLLKVEYGGVQVGDLIYDTILNETREGTVSRLDKEVYRRVLDGVRLFRFYEGIFRKYDIRAVVLRDVVYSRMGLLARVALHHGAEVYVQRPLPPDIIRVRRYTEPGEIHTYQHRPSRELFTYVNREHRKEAVQAAENYMRERMNPDAPMQDRVDVWNAYGSGKVSLSRREIAERLGLDGDKPMAVIMSHAFTDAPHANNWALFRDYLVWLRETVEFAKNHPETNWLVKAHPSAAIYNCHQNDEDEVTRITQGIENHTVRLLPSEISTRSLLEFADVILTVCGTAGLEFSCFGIPCVLAGESPYSGFGFTVEPKTGEEYFRLLGNIGQVKRLDQEQVARAKVVAYIYFVLLGTETSFLSPELLYIGRLDREKARQARESIARQADPETDPFFANFKQFVASGCRHLVREPEYYRTCSSGAEEKGAVTGA